MLATLAHAAIQVAASAAHLIALVISPLLDYPPFG
jgi:hypothetical protein